MPVVNILIADDHSITRRGLRALLETDRRWRVCCEASTGVEAVLKAKRLKPDLIILDLSMPELGGLEATRQIRQALPELPVLILTMHDSEELIQEVVSAGAQGYVLKSDLDINLITGVELLLKGKTFFSAKVSEILLDGYVKNAHSQLAMAQRRSQRLSPRQKEIVRHLAEGMLNKEVAAALGISAKTVEAHRAQIMTKLGLRSFSELVRYAVREHIVKS